VRRWKAALPYVAGGFAALVLMGVFGLLFMSSGLYNVAASSPHTRPMEWLLHGTMIQSVRRHAKSVVAPARFTNAQVLAGFCQYEAHCVACHGAAGVAREHWVSGIEPAPPYLLDATARWNRAELFWIAKNGIKMTGMPAWTDTMADRDVWNVVAFLEASREMPSQTYLQWRSQRRCGVVNPGAGP
jgi:mono/diheme cytochrome c family protein